MTRKISLFKKYAHLKSFQSRVKWSFLFVISFFVLEIFKFSFYANLVTYDVIGCASTLTQHKIQNISANNAAMLLKLGSDVAPRCIPDGTHFDVAMATCLVPVSCLFKIKYCHL